MFITKTTPAVAQNGKIKSDIKIKNNVLEIGESIKFEDGKWYRLGDDEIWYFLGFGANPAHETDADGILSQTLFDAVFEEVAE